MHTLEARSLLTAILFATVLSFVGAFYTPQSANADLHGRCVGGLYQCLPDGTYHTWCFGPTMDGNANLQNAVQYAMTNMVEQTQMTENKDNSCDSSTDVVWQERDLVGLRGEHECLERVSGSPNKCAHSAARLDGDAITADSPQGAEQLNREKTSCHELGHTLGLNHDYPQDDCMVLGAVAAGHRTYNDHHREHVNSI